MRTLLQNITTLAWALWLGGLASLFLFVTTLFRNDHEQAAHTAPQLFLAFERYQIILAAVSVVGTLAWRWTNRSALLDTILILFALATALSVLSSSVLTPRILQFAAEGETHTPEFLKAHGESMLAYTTETALLLIAGLILPWAARVRRTN
jgi:Domain of unknown function (DUF4149)